MIVAHTLDEITYDERSAITIGTFDGVHVGHRAIITALVEKAREWDGRSVVVTFDPHPQVVLRRKGDSVPLLTSASERDALLGALGVDVVLVLPFTVETAATPWQEFVDVLLRRVGIAHIIFGHDHAFGRDRGGTAETLRALGEQLARSGHRGFGASEVGPHLIDGEPVSSTKIRRALSEGSLDVAERYLGYRYGVTGTVVRGDGRGRQLGIPTANVQPLDDAKLLPGNGVYCVEMVIDGERIAGMANIGVRPTFTDATVRTLEVNLFDFERDIYERRVIVEFVRFVRSEQKFSSAEEFLAQLERDRDTCRAARVG